jgi:hypothetical protein
MRHLLSAFIATAACTTALAAPAVAEPIIYQGVRYQYGTHGEIFYGGVNPQFLPTGFPVPNTPATQALANHFGFPNPNYRTNIFNGPTGQFPPLIYTDLVPFDEAGHLGFTIDDARNEAYFNMPRYYRATPTAATAAPAAAAPAAVVVTAAQQRAKAIPLLSWARSDSARKNPELQRALLDEAAKYAPVESAKTRAELGL